MIATLRAVAAARQRIAALPRPDVQEWDRTRQFSDRLDPIGAREK